MEVLVSIAVLAIIGVGVSAISLSGVIAIKDSTAERQDVAVATQLATMVFARDVQGSSGVVEECAGSVGGSHLFTLGPSVAGDASVEYRYSEKPRMTSCA